MSEKQFEKRSLFKALSRQFSFSRSSFSRSRSTSEQERASSEQSEQERASSSVVESDVNDQEFQRIVRDESSEKLINEYVKQRFQSYLNNNVEDVDL
jgi:hypothetical protein